MAISQDRLRQHPLQADQIAILQAALSSVDPGTLMKAMIRVTRNTLVIEETSFPLHGRRVWILAIGKAAVPMSQALERMLGPNRITDGVAVTRFGQAGITDRVRVIESGHPLPSVGVGAEAIATLANRVAADDLVLCLLSGGGSALLASPPSGITVVELAQMTELLLHCGATIDEMNIVRRHVSTLQGGQLMALLQPATVVTLILSDVLSDRLESIASGPTVPDPTSFADACDVLRTYGVWDRLPASIRSRLQTGRSGLLPETPKPGDPLFDTSHTYMLGNNATAVNAMKLAAQASGFDVHERCEPLLGEAQDVGSRLADRALQLASGARKKWALIGGGETTVTVHGDGIGGRNQELALAAALRLEGVPNLSLSALGTDGMDGPTEAAGAIVDGDTAVVARRLGIEPREALARNDSHRVLDATGDLLWTGPTSTNVADVALVLGMPRA